MLHVKWKYLHQLLKSTDHADQSVVPFLLARARLSLFCCSSSSAVELSAASSSAMVSLGSSPWLLGVWLALLLSGLHRGRSQRVCVLAVLDSQQQ